MNKSFITLATVIAINSETIVKTKHGENLGHPTHSEHAIEKMSENRNVYRIGENIEFQGGKITLATLATI